ncbi:MAG: prephenate dehydrogenase/arogenate dehydrogenase family protein [Deltaproteobacteria bacterium]|nr:prephenate dehydrogenase/arogenate dehydrogenase family protein [Deltaproteobacteria bacterium]
MNDDESKQAFNRITIIGTGVIGCSVACMIKGCGLAEEVVGVDSLPANLEMARRLGFIDRGLEDPARGVMGADAVIVATPLQQVFMTIEKIGPDMRPGAMLTCTAGTTLRIWQQIIKEVKEAEGFVPSFPLVFTKSNGPAVASPMLLQGRRCLVASCEAFDQVQVARVAGFWKDLGMDPQIVDDSKFEWSVAAGHLWPQLITQRVRQLAVKNEWELGESVIKHWLDAVGQSNDLERSYQLYSKKLNQLLTMLVEELTQLKRDLGGASQSQPDQAEGAE